MQNCCPATPDANAGGFQVDRYIGNFELSG